MTLASACIKFCKIGVFRINSQQQRRINTCGMLDAQLSKSAVSAHVARLREWGQNEFSRASLLPALFPLHLWGA